MFDVELSPEETYRESDGYCPGDRAVIAQTPFGKFGMTICYDVRFPDLYQALVQAGAGGRRYYNRAIRIFDGHRCGPLDRIVTGACYRNRLLRAGACAMWHASHPAWQSPPDPWSQSGSIALG